MFRCTLTNGWDEELIRAKSSHRAAMIYRDVLRERGSSVPDSIAHVYRLVEPEGDEGLVYEPEQEPRRYDMSGAHVRRAA